MTMKTRLFAMVSVCSALLAVNASGQSTGLLNVDFAADPNNPKLGAAAYGQTGDYWNPIYCGQTALNNLEWANTNTSPSSVGLALSANATGCWGLGSSDSMYNGYTYPGYTQSMTIAFSNLPLGLYDFYVYGYDGNYQLATGGADYGPRLTRDWPVSNPQVWQEGRQYARFWSVGIAGAGQPLTLTVQPGLDHYAVISGMQIAPAATEVWISPTGTANTGAMGTQSDPFICPDGASLQAVLTMLPPNITIHLNAGQFTVNPGIQVKPGWKLHGAGTGGNGTTFTLQANAPFNANCKREAVIGSGWDPTTYIGISADGVEVWDMIVDCNGTNQNYAPVCLTAVQIYGSNTLIHNVKAINWGSNLYALECYPLQLATVGNGTIEYCEVTKPAQMVVTDPILVGTYGGAMEGTTAIISGPQGVLRSNWVHDVDTGAPKMHFFHGYWADGRLEYNNATNIFGSMASAIYQDFRGDMSIMANTLIYTNSLVNVVVGIYFNKDSGAVSTGAQIVGNYCRPREGGAGIVLYTPPSTSGSVTDCHIYGNTVYPFDGVSVARALDTTCNGNVYVTYNTLQAVGNLPDWRFDDGWWVNQGGCCLTVSQDLANYDRSNNPVHLNNPIAP